MIVRGKLCIGVLSVAMVTCNKYTREKQHKWLFYAFAFLDL